MRKSHMYLFGVAVVTFGLVAAAPGTANSRANATAIAVQAGADLNPEQLSEFGSWPSERQAQYELWPAETQAYYWMLSPERQMLFWRLTDEDKIALTAMTGPERENAWGQIESRASKPPSDG